MREIDKERLEYLLAVFASENRWLGHYQAIGNQEFINMTAENAKVEQENIIRFIEGFIDGK